jgi:hypothetical protein
MMTSPIIFPVDADKPYSASAINNKRNPYQSCLTLNVLVVRCAAGQDQ